MSSIILTFCRYFFAVRISRDSNARAAFSPLQTDQHGRGVRSVAGFLARLAPVCGPGGLPVGVGASAAGAVWRDMPVADPVIPRGGYWAVPVGSGLAPQISAKPKKPTTTILKKSCKNKKTIQKVPKSRKNKKGHSVRAVVGDVAVFCDEKNDKN